MSKFNLKNQKSLNQRFEEKQFFNIDLIDLKQKSNKLLSRTQQSNKFVPKNNSNNQNTRIKNIKNQIHKLRIDYVQQLILPYLNLNDIRNFNYVNQQYQSSFKFNLKRIKKIYNHYNSLFLIHSEDKQDVVFQHDLREKNSKPKFQIQLKQKSIVMKFNIQKGHLAILSKIQNKWMIEIICIYKKLTITLLTIIEENLNIINFFTQTHNGRQLLIGEKIFDSNNQEEIQTLNQIQDEFKSQNIQSTENKIYNNKSIQIDTSDNIIQRLNENMIQIFKMISNQNISQYNDHVQDHGDVKYQNNYNFDFIHNQGGKIQKFQNQKSKIKVMIQKAKLMIQVKKILLQSTDLPLQSNYYVEFSPLGDVFIISNQELFKLFKQNNAITVNDNDNITELLSKNDLSIKSVCQQY